MNNPPFLPQRGNYRNLIAFQKSECIYDITVLFTRKYLLKGDRTIDQMVQAARSGKQNIAEGCAASTTSRETEIKLLNVAKASLQELLLDYEDYLRVNHLKLWEIGNSRLEKLRNICTNNTDSGYYREIFEKCNDEMICNLAITLIHQTDLFLRKLIDRAKSDFLQEGGVREQMTRGRLEYRKNHNNHPQ
ncbi:MAG: four helix bundle suffix domain-containing protein [Muribaculaceae bacterium]|nr:four helix bundle suffix domain-containing protein [Muribaculaceae bacterium]